VIIGMNTVTSTGVMIAAIMETIATTATVVTNALTYKF
jgi:hypothetical protein